MPTVARDVLDRGEPASKLSWPVSAAGCCNRTGSSIVQRSVGSFLGSRRPARPRGNRPGGPAKDLAEIERADRVGARAVIIEAIKLVEGGLAEECDEIWLVTCEPDVQRSRLIGRGMPSADADQRMAAQGDRARGLASLATRVINTSGSQEETRAELRRAWLGAVDHGTGG
jgi:dephospho-CoA kinase